MCKLLVKIAIGLTTFYVGLHAGSHQAFKCERMTPVYPLRVIKVFCTCLISHNYTGSVGRENSSKGHGVFSIDEGQHGAQEWRYGAHVRHRHVA